MCAGLASAHGHSEAARLERAAPAPPEGLVAGGAGVRDARSYERARIANGLEAFPTDWPRAVNRRTVAGLVAGSAKRPVPEEVLKELTARGIAVTTDEVVRLRAYCRLDAHAPPVVRNVERETAVLGEFVMAERGLRAIRFDGSPQALVTVENKGPFVDFPNIPGALFIFMPGWDMDLARVVLEVWTSVPIYHFGDLDPAGAAMARSLSEVLGRTIRWVVLDAASLLLASHAADDPTPWPPSVPPYPVLQALVHQGQWLEQEPLVLSRDFPHTIADLHTQSVPFEV